MPRRDLLCRCSYYIYACWHSVTVTNTAAVQTCLLVECCCKIDTCSTVATQSACLLTFCHSILQVCRRCASLSAIPAGMVSHYQPSLLVWCFIIGRAFWFGTSLSAMHVGKVSHYRQCLLVRFALQPTFWLVECRGKRDGYKFGATLTEMPLHQTCLLIGYHSQICLLVQ